MKISDEFMNFINSSDDELYCNESSSYYNYYYVKKETKEPNLCMIYLLKKDKENDFAEQTLQYLCTIDKSKQECIHKHLYNVGERAEFIFGNDFDTNEFQELNHFVTNIKLAVREKVYDYYHNHEDEILKDFDLSIYDERVEKMYINEQSADIYIDFEFNVTLDSLIEYNKDKEKFIENIAKKEIENNREEMTKQITLKTALNQYKEKLLHDPLATRRQAILDILNNGKYKNFKIKYMAPNNTILNTGYSKDSCSYRRTRGDLISDNKFNEIPIKSIQQILWGRSILYDTNEFDKLEYPIDEHIDDFFELNITNQFPKEYYSDKNFVRRLLDNNYIDLYLVDKDLALDQNFILEFLNETHKFSAIPHLNKEIFKDDNFINTILDLLNKNKDTLKKYEIECILTNLPDDIYDNLEFVLKICDIIDYDNIKVLDKISDEVFNDNEFISYINSKGQKLTATTTLIEKVKNVDNLQNLFDRTSLQKNIQYFNDDILEDRDFILDILQDCSKVNKYILSHNTKIVELYADDKAILNLIAASVHPNQVKTFMDVAKVDTTDKSRLFELASLNNGFFKVLDAIDLEIYLTGEAAGIEDISIKKDCANILFCKTSYGEFVINTSNDYIYYKDENEQESRITGVVYSPVCDAIHEIINELYPKYNDSTYKTFNDIYRDLRTELINKEREMER